MDLQPNKIDGIFLPITNNRISASEWNQLVGSCMAFITEAGLTPDASDNKQFLNAFKTIAAELEIVGANTNLSNLTATGEARFTTKANTNLSNLTATGEARFTTKANTDLSNVNNTGKSTSAGWAMPSVTYTDLTLGASNSTYTAPANGWFMLEKLASGNGQELRFTNLSNGLAGYAISPTNNATLDVSVQCKKGDVVRLYYSASGNLHVFRFIYAEGSKSEAN